MCRQVTCKTCGKQDWAGCGQHVDSVMRGIARSERCAGHTLDAPRPGLWKRLFSR